MRVNRQGHHGAQRSGAPSVPYEPARHGRDHRQDRVPDREAASMLPLWGVDRSKAGAFAAPLAVFCSAILGFALTRPSMPAGVHDSDSALYIVEAISLEQTSPWDARPEWNTLVRLA